MAEVNFDAKNFNPGFSEGLSKGMDWAQRQAGVELQRSQLDLQKTEFEENRRQWNIQAGQKALADLERIVSQPKGKVREARKIQFLNNMASLNIPVHPEVAAALDDEPEAAKMAQAFQGLRRGVMNGQIPQDYFGEVAGWLGSEKALDLVGKFNDDYQKMQQIAATGKESRTTQAEGAQQAEALEEKKAGHTIQAKVVDASLKPKGERLPEGSKAFIKDLAQKRSTVSTSKVKLDEALTDLNNPKISDKQKVLVGRQILKTMNDISQSDAIAEHERKAVGDLLNGTLIPSFDSVKNWGFGSAEVAEFSKQVKLSSDRVARIVDGMTALEEAEYAKEGAAPTAPASGGSLADKKAAVQSDLLDAAHETGMKGTKAGAIKKIEKPADGATVRQSAAQKIQAQAQKRQLAKESFMKLPPTAKKNVMKLKGQLSRGSTSLDEIKAEFAKQKKKIPADILAILEAGD